MKQYIYSEPFDGTIQNTMYNGIVDYSGEYKIEVVQDFIDSGFLVKVKETNLNPLFIDLIRNFAHLVNITPQSKTDFLANIKKTYSIDNPKTELFYMAVERSEFETIRLTKNRNSILFNY